MPKRGQKTITVPEKVYEKAKRCAEEENKSVAGLVSEIIVENCNNKEDD